MEAQQKENVVTLGKLSELLDSIEQSAAVLRNALKTEHPRVEDDSGQDSAEIASSLNLPFHSSESVAIHASRLRVNSERLAQLATPPRHLVFEAAGSFYVTMALDVVTKADIATIIHKLSGKSGQEGVPVQVLAQESRLDGDLLARILRHLAVFGIFQEISLGNFANTPASATLVDDAEFRAHLDLVMHEGRMAIPFFPELVSRRFTASESLPAPPSAFSIYSDGQPFYEWLHSPSQTDRNLNFNIAMRGMANTEGIAFLPMDYPFHSLPTEKPIVDVGGGIGTLPMLLLPTLPRHSFLVQDLEPVVKQAQAAPNDSIKQWMAEGKIKFSVQDCFSPQPPEVDGAVFILKNMIHNYSEPKALEILHNLRRKNPFKLLLIDRLVIPQIQSVDSSARLSGSSQRAATMYDLVMASLHGGKNRTLEEWENLLQRADFRLEKIYPLRASTGQAVMEAICA